MEAKRPDLRRILAANIKEQRTILGISQEKLAEMAGLSWQTINSIECQRTWVSDNTLETLANVFKIETFQLLLPLELRMLLSQDGMETLHQLIQAKRSYDESFNEIICPKRPLP
ncbi:MAG: helix-turn-helix domain-containing protein [Treponema sp.]|jgi:transcriptional regulator with XRE-family HTH domain|nr:helix-turn-helix domain-containing protein [Treponema sp.]